MTLSDRKTWNNVSELSLEELFKLGEEVVTDDLSSASTKSLYTMAHVFGEIANRSRLIYRLEYLLDPSERNLMSKDLDNPMELLAYAERCDRNWEACFAEIASRPLSEDVRAA